MPEAPSTDNLRRVQARVGAFGGAEVKVELRRWVEGRDEFFREAQTLDDMERSGKEEAERHRIWGLTSASQRIRMDAARRQLFDLARQLEDAVSAELRSAKRRFVRLLGVPAIRPLVDTGSVPGPCQATADWQQEWQQDEPQENRTGHIRRSSGGR